MKKSERKMQKSAAQDQSRDPMRTEDRFAEKTEQLEKPGQAKKEGQPNQQNNSENGEVEENFCTKRKRMIILIGTVVALIMAIQTVISVFIIFPKTFQPKSEPANPTPPIQVGFSDENSRLIGQYHLVNKNISNQNADLKFLIHTSDVSNSPITKQTESNQQNVLRVSLTTEQDGIGPSINLQILVNTIFSYTTETLCKITQCPQILNTIKSNPSDK